MATQKINRAELKKRRRIQMYKKVILYAFLWMTILPIISGCILLHKVDELEKKLDYALAADGGDYLTFQSSRDALLSNPGVQMNMIADADKNLRGNNTPSTDVVANTKEDAEVSTNVEGANVDSTEASTTSGSKVKSSKEKNTKINSNGKKVYLTFDDGPSLYTGQILDILKANNVKATFFVIGRDEEYYPYYKRIVDEGHTIGMHSYTHVYQKLYASKESFTDEIEKLSGLIYDVTGVKCKIFRFPGGSSNHVSTLPIEDYIDCLDEMGITYYDWNALSGDAINPNSDPSTLVNNIMNNVEANDGDSIVLMHDLQTTHKTVESLQLLIDTLKSEGYEILPIDENTPLIQHAAEK